jgi:hypothetical protein
MYLRKCGNTTKARISLTLYCMIKQVSIVIRNRQFTNVSGESTTSISEIQLKISSKLKVEMTGF